MKKIFDKIKEYPIESLLDNYDDIVKRCRLIEEISNTLSFIPNTQITIDGESLKYQQDLIKRKNYKDLNNKQKMGLLEQFAQDLDSLVPYGFVHGDINSTNVLYDGVRLNLIDLEPSFKQLKYGKKVVLSAP